MTNIINEENGITFVKRTYCITLFLTYVISGIIVDISGNGMGLYSLTRIDNKPIRIDLIIYSIIVNICFSIPCFLLLLRRSIYLFAPIIGLFISIPGISLIIFDYISFVSIAWHIILGLSFITILIFGSLMLSINKSRTTKKQEIYVDYLKLLLQGVLALGTILGVMLSFLFKGGMENLDRSNKLMGLQMLIGFSITIIVLYIWVVIPILKNIALFKETRITQPGRSQ